MIESAVKLSRQVGAHVLENGVLLSGGAPVFEHEIRYSQAVSGFGISGVKPDSLYETLPRLLELPQRVVHQAEIIMSYRGVGLEANRLLYLEISPKIFLKFSTPMLSDKTRAFYESGPSRLDPAERQLVREGQPLQLTPKVFDTLLALVERRGRLVEKDEFMKLVWADAGVEEANLARAVHTLRKALGEEHNEHKYIETVP